MKESVTSASRPIYVWLGGFLGSREETDLPIVPVPYMSYSSFKNYLLPSFCWKIHDVAC